MSGFKVFAFDGMRGYGGEGEEPITTPAPTGQLAVGSVVWLLPSASARIYLDTTVGALPRLALIVDREIPARVVISVPVIEGDGGLITADVTTVALLEPVELHTEGAVSELRQIGAEVQVMLPKGAAVALSTTPTPPPIRRSPWVPILVGAGMLTLAGACWLAYREGVRADDDARDARRKQGR